MERLNSRPNNSTSHLPGRRRCQADDSLRSDDCKRRGGLIEQQRARSARYCNSCACVVRREQSKLGKRQLRRNLRWRANQRLYRKQKLRRKKHSAYMRKWRALRRQAGAAAYAEQHRRAA
jgi:hypothetical protein